MRYLLKKQKSIGSSPDFDIDFIPEVPKLSFNCSMTSVNLDLRQ